jgi:hypothetical protein
MVVKGDEDSQICGNLEGEEKCEVNKEERCMKSGIKM